MACCLQVLWFLLFFWGGGNKTGYHSSSISLWFVYHQLTFQQSAQKIFQRLECQNRNRTVSKPSPLWVSSYHLHHRWDFNRQSMLIGFSEVTEPLRHADEWKLIKRCVCAMEGSKCSFFLHLQPISGHAAERGRVDLLRNWNVIEGVVTRWHSLLFSPQLLSIKNKWSIRSPPAFIKS